MSAEIVRHRLSCPEENFSLLTGLSVYRHFELWLLSEAFVVVTLLMHSTQVVYAPNNTQGALWFSKVDQLFACLW